MATKTTDNDEVSKAMAILNNYIGSDARPMMLMNLISENYGTTTNTEKPYNKDSIGAKISKDYVQISDKGADFTTFLYNTAHIPAIYDGYSTKINFVDLIRDKMSKVNKAIYTKLSNNDPKFAKKCFCAMKDGVDTTYEGIMESQPYQKEEKIVDLLT